MVVKASSTVGGVPASGAIVTNGETFPLSGPDSTRNFGTVTANVSGGSIQRVNLPTGSTVVTNAAGALNVVDADGTSVDCTATIQPQTGELTFVSVPGTAALVTNGLSVSVANNGGGGARPGTAAITGGFINWIALTNTTDCLLSNGFSTSVAGFAVSGVGDFATANVSAGGLQSVTVSLEPTKAVVSNAGAIEIENQGDTQSVGGTVIVAAGVAVARLPANAALVGNNVAIVVPVTGTYVDTITPQVNGAGVITGFTLS